MAGNPHPIRTKEILVTGFETPPPPISGEINLRELIRIWKHCKNCAQQTETNYYAQNFLYAVLPQLLWMYFSIRPRPAEPQDAGSNPSYDNNASTTHNATIRDTRQLENKNYEEHKHFNRVLADQFLSLVPLAYKRSFISQQLTKNPKMTFLQVFE